MRILLVAPDQQGLNLLPEIRRISEIHTVHTLNGDVTIDDLYNAVQHNHYHIIHYATHCGGDDGQLDTLVLSNANLDLAAAAQIAKLARTKLVFLNACQTARFAAYLIQHGTPEAIFTTVAIEDRVAWRTPVAFYERCHRAEAAGEPLNFNEMLRSVESGNGHYCWVGAPSAAANLTPIWDAIRKIEGKLAEILTIIDNRKGFPSALPSNNAKLLLYALYILWSIASTLVVLNSLGRW